MMEGFEINYIHRFIKLVEILINYHGTGMGDFINKMSSMN